MKLSSAYLSEQLNQRFEILRQNNISREDGYLRPYLCTEADENRPEHVCVHPVTRKEAKPEILDITAGEALVISCDASITARLLNYLQELFDHCDEREKQTDYQNVLRQAESFNAALKSIFAKILSERTADYVEMSRRLTGEGWEQEHEHEYFCLVLQVGSRKDPYLWIHYFDQIALTHILEQATRRLPADMLCHEGLLRLKEADEKNHTEYVRTLRTWLDVGMNATRCAEKLFIHRSTFLYRLDRIKEILHSDLKDPEEIFYIALSIRLLKQK